MAKAPIILVLILFITIPIWIAAGGMVFGIMMGLVGALFGLLGAIFGILFGIVGGMFHLLFGMGWHEHHFFFNKYTFLALLIVAAIAISKKRERNN